MRDGRVNRAIEKGKARTTDIKTRVPELRERMPELRERVPELTDGLRSRGGELARQYAKMDVSWARCSYAKAARAALLGFGLGPMIDYYVRTRVVGGEVFDRLSHPVIFVANHSSHLDTPTILRSLPRKWRRNTAVAAAADYFYNKRWKANGVALLFNTVPLGRKGGGLGNGATDHVDRLIDEGWNLVMFPEGTRSRDGEVGKVRSGAAVIAAHHGIDIVPIYIYGTHEAMPPGRNWPKRIPGRVFSRRHEVEVRFGDPIRPRAADDRHEVMDEVRSFWQRKGLAAASVLEPADAREREAVLTG
jgi:1-acyl-sn-glycerol-3-phosphate acyltransferase